MKVHLTKCTITYTHRQIYIYIYIYTCVMHNAMIQSEKINETLPTFQEYDPTRYRKCKTDITIPRERGPSKEQEK